MPANVLIVDDDVGMCEMVQSDLHSRGITAAWVGTVQAAEAALREDDYEVVLTDVRMPGGHDGIDLCRNLKTTHPEIPVVVITAFGSLDTAIAALRAGAHDFVTKPVDLDLLSLVIGRALEHRRLTEQVKVLENAAASVPFADLIGRSEPMSVLFQKIERVAASEASAIIFGESGTGKELVARALHERGPRSSGPFVAINCASLPEPLLESELFGHVKGAFTDARTAHRGLFQQASGGTLFLDEIGELPVALQPKLLRALEERRVRPVGGTNEEAFDVRLVSATNRDLEAAVEDGRFREDLYFRVHVIQLTVPPLRARGSDVLLIAKHFLDVFAQRSGKAVAAISEPAAKALLSYSWPGNVRELRNAIEHAVALTRYDRISVDDLPERIREHRTDRLLIDSDPEQLVKLEEVERRYILHVLQAVGGNRTVAARVLGIDRKTLYRKLRTIGGE